MEDVGWCGWLCGSKPILRLLLHNRVIAYYDFNSLWLMTGIFGMMRDRWWQCCVVLLMTTNSNRRWMGNNDDGNSVCVAHHMAAFLIAFVCHKDTVRVRRKKMTHSDDCTKSHLCWIEQKKNRPSTQSEKLFIWSWRLFILFPTHEHEFIMGIDGRPNGTY